MKPNASDTLLAERRDRLDTTAQLREATGLAGVAENLESLNQLAASQTNERVSPASQTNERVSPASQTNERVSAANVLAIAATLTFRATARDRSGSTLGVLVDASGAQQHLSLGADGAWALTSALPPSAKSHLVYESAANLLRGGSLGPDGSISYQGDSYVIVSRLDGNTLTARVSGSA